MPKTTKPTTETADTPDDPDRRAPERVKEALAADPLVRAKPRKRARFVLDDDDFEDLFNDVPV